MSESNASSPVKASGEISNHTSTETQTQATTESTDLARDETQVQPPEDTYTRTKTAENKCTRVTEDTDIKFPGKYDIKTTEESKPSLLNGKDISFYYIKKKLLLLPI